MNTSSGAFYYQIKSSHSSEVYHVTITLKEPISFVFIPELLDKNLILDFTHFP